MGTLGLHKDFYTNQAFWDCECEHKYIHKAGTKSCEVCGAREEEQPDSRELEVNAGHFFHVYTPSNWQIVGAKNALDLARKYSTGEKVTGDLWVTQKLIEGLVSVAHVLLYGRLA